MTPKTVLCTSSVLLFHVSAPVMAASEEDVRARSPSERFYAEPEKSSLADVDQQQHSGSWSTHQQQQRAASLGQYEGFSITHTQRHEHPSMAAPSCQVPEEMISPRMPIPNLAVHNAHRPQQQHFVGVDPLVTLEAKQHSYHTCAGLEGFDIGCAQTVAEAWPPYPQVTPLEPPSPHAHTSRPTTSLTQASGFFLSPAPHDRHTICPPRILAGIPDTLDTAGRLPPCSMLNPYVGQSGTPSSHERRATSTEHEKMKADPLCSASRSDDSGGGVTIYPEDSRSAAGEPRLVVKEAEDDQTWSGCDVADDIVEVHDVCLLASQRYLENLRANWDLRNGEPISTAGTGAGRRRRPAASDHKARADAAPRHVARWSPYPLRPLHRRRAQSESDLQACGPMVFPTDLLDDDHHDDRYHHHNEQTDHNSLRERRNPIPLPTTSLLHNVHHISALIWRRAQRDRDDVPGAEASGCRAMARMHERVERVVLHRREDLVRDPEGCWRRVVEAGKALCRELGDGEGFALLERWDVDDGGGEEGDEDGGDDEESEGEGDDEDEEEDDVDGDSYAV